MKDLSVTQQYLLCALKKNGRLPIFGIEKTVCLSASGVLELLMEEVLAFDGKKLTIRTSLPAEKAYLHPVYEMVEKKQPVKFEKVVEYFSVTLTDKHLRELIDRVGESLAEAGCVRREKGGLLGERNLYIPEESAVDAIVQNIRAEILEDGALSEDIVALTALLNKSGDLQKYFSAYEKNDLKRRLREIKENPQNEMIQRVSEYINTLFAMIIVAST